MTRIPRRAARALRTLLGALCACAALAPLVWAEGARSEMIRVDWEATVSELAGAEGLGSGTLSGSLGTFDVQAAGDEFELPADGTLEITVEGFSGVPNGTYPLDDDFFGEPLRFRFALSDDVPSELVGGTLAADLDPGGTYLRAGIAGNDEAGVLRGDLANSVGPIVYTFTCVEPPCTGSLPRARRALDPPLLSFGFPTDPNPVLFLPWGLEGVGFGEVLAAGDFLLGRTGLPHGDLAIGSPSWQDRGIREGRTMRYHGNPLFWTASRLPEVGDNSFARRGAALAIGDFDGDGEGELAEGAPGTLVNGRQAGVVYVDGVAWHQDLPGVLGIATAGDRFGEALAVGNFNGDAYDDLAIGIPGKDLDGRNDAGAVQILFGSAAGLTATGNQQWGQDLLAATHEAGDEFGVPLAAGDLDGDGKDDLIVGVPKETVSSQFQAGVIHILYGSSGALVDGGWWAQGSPGVPGAREVGDEFGAALAMGHFDGDAYEDLAIGIPGENADGGMVQIFYGAPGGFTVGGLWNQGVIGLGTLDAGDRFGASLTTSDFDDDGYVDLAIGAPGETVYGLTGAGSVQVVYGSAAGLDAEGSELFDRTQPGVQFPAAGDAFGTSLAATDFDANGGVDLLVGAPGEGSGRVYILAGGQGHCEDGRDNDLDGLVDLDDPDCANADDPFEGGTPCTSGCWTDFAISGHLCNNGIDEDGDGLLDGDDPLCAGGLSAERHIDGSLCDNGIDEDHDGRADFDLLTRQDPLYVAGRGDPACFSPTFMTEETACQDGVDNDGAPGTDFDGGASRGVSDPAGADPQCTAPWRDAEAGRPACGLGFEFALIGPAWMALRRRRRERRA